jgi:hypothetical protein
MVDKQKHSGDTGRSILRQIDELQRMSMSELRKKWSDLIGGDSANQSKQYMVRRLAYRLQELSLGGFAKNTRDSLTGWAVNPQRAESKAVREKAALQLGTRLLRDWHGHGSPCSKQPDRGYQSSEDRLCGGLQGRPTQSLSAGFLKADLFVRRVPGVVCFSDTAVQYNHIDGTAEITNALSRLDPIWEVLYPEEQSRILELLIESVTVSENNVDIRFRTNGIERIVEELTSQN